MWPKHQNVPERSKTVQCKKERLKNARNNNQQTCERFQHIQLVWTDFKIHQNLPHFKMSSKTYWNWNEWFWMGEIFSESSEDPANRSQQYPLKHLETIFLFQYPYFAKEMINFGIDTGSHWRLWVYYHSVRYVLRHLGSSWKHVCCE